MLIFRRTNCIITAPGIVTLCKRPYSMPVESGNLKAGNLKQVYTMMHGQKNIKLCAVF